MATVTRVYETHSQALVVVAELEKAEIRPDDISLIGPHVVHDGSDTSEGAVSSAGIGAAVGGGAGLLAGLGMLAIPGAGPIIAAGWLAATAAGAVGGAVAGGFAGALMDAGVNEADAQAYAEAVRSGATMVSVRASDGDEPVVVAIMDGLSPIKMAVRRAGYEGEESSGLGAALPAATGA